MRVSTFFPRRAGLLAPYFALGVVAQREDDNSNDNNNNSGNEDDGPNDRPPADDDPPANPPPADDTTTNDRPRPTTTNRPEETATGEDEPPEETPTTTENDEPPTTTAEDEEPTTTEGPTDLPDLSTSTTATTPFTRPTDMPTLSRTVNTEIPTYPPPTIPPTKNAPFMNHSTLPDGTVFIAVGAILGAFGVAILLWRAIVACLLHRSVERAALAQRAVNNGRGTVDKNAASFPAPPAQFYKYLERESSASLTGPGVGSSSGRRTNRGTIPSATPSQTNLFYSPTAGGPSTGMGGANRDSARFLPSGFYAAASSGSGGHAHGNSISMSTLRPSSRGRGGQPGPSPPESPDVGPRVMSRNFSTSSLNLNHPPSPGHRAPSAYLDDLLDEQPGMFPPAAGNGPPQGHGSQRGRY
ncbi:hypothetical protein VTH82DRAFT_5732 [Thermothelomyces myriococcoides]